MLFSSLHIAATASLLLGSALAGPPLLDTFAQLVIDSGVALSGLNTLALANSILQMRGSCTPDKLKIRQEWRTLSSSQRKNYIAAVKCVQTKKSLFPAGAVPGSKGLYEDFAAVHINQTLTIHLTGTFLTWHRYYILTFEQALQSCGYTGNLPYWEWGFDVNSPRNSPVFDGSDTSLGGDGAAISHAGLMLAQPGTSATINVPPGTGGGCVNTGPFANMITRLGPVILPVYGSTNTTGVANPFGDNPRCLKRDLNPYVAKKWTSFRNTTELILQNNNVELFQAILQGDPRYTTLNLGTHGGGHFTIGGDPGSDPFISPGDPAFYLHHGQVDRIFWIWQMLDFANRQNVAGTNTFFNLPPSANTTVNDFIDLGVLSTPVQIKNLMNTVGGSPLCYVYV